MKDKPLLTIFSCPKPFRDNINIIQRNAIKSWTLLQPRSEIILIGNEKGIAEICEEFRLRHISIVEKNEYGTPLISSIFAEAEKASSCDLMCYVNTDIILMSDFVSSVQNVLKFMQKFLMIGRRWDIGITEELNFSENWEENLKSLLSSQGKLHGRWGIDFFVFSKGLFGNILPFAIGRYSWDNWLIYRAYSQKIPVVNVTSVTNIAHQNHGYKFQKTFDNIEIKRNFAFLGWRGYGFSVLNATHELTPKGLKKNSSSFHLIVEMDRFIRFVLKISRMKIHDIFHL